MKEEVPMSEPVSSVASAPDVDEEPSTFEADKWVNPRTVDPRDRFSIPSHELRKDKYDRLQKMESDKEKEKVEKEAAEIAHKADRIIDYNKKSIRENEYKYNIVEKGDLLSRQNLHKKLKKQKSDYKMQKDLEEQLEVEKTIKRANQITSSVREFEKKETDKNAADLAEEDAFYREDEENEKLKNKLKKELDKEEKAALKKERKDKEERAKKGWDRPAKFMYPDEQKALNAKEAGKK